MPVFSTEECMSVVSVYRIDPNNIGDMRSAPALYFPFLAGESLDLEVLDERSVGAVDGKFVVVGGSGCVDFDGYAQKVAAVGGRRAAGKVAWGCGTNTRGAFPDYGSLAGYDLVGVRDWGLPLRWVPCASCMDPLFDEVRDEPAVFPVVGYFHSGFARLNLGVPEMDNSTRDFGKALRHIASGEVVVTNSYHGAYWATLLGRSVVVVAPWSSKFFCFRHPPVMTAWEDVGTAVCRAVCYLDALRECREANMAFAEDVRGLMGLKTERG